MICTNYTTPTAALDALFFGCRIQVELSGYETSSFFICNRDKKDIFSYGPTWGTMKRPDMTPGKMCEHFANMLKEGAKLYSIDVL